MKIFGKGDIDGKRKKITVSNLGDHRICMSSFILAILTGAKTLIKNFETVNTSSPSFLQLMKLIEDVIKAEKKPKSDKRIAIELNKRGFGLARRTITKYRKKNNIPSSRHR